MCINCRAYERERIQLKEELKSAGINSMTLQNVLNSSHKGYKALINFLKRTNVYNKIKVDFFFFRYRVIIYLFIYFIIIIYKKMN